jgi:uncharacterized YccA/Bax inhibitor family protein
MLVAFVLGLVIAFKQIANPAATLAYGALYGVALGAISEAFNDIYPGIVMQALIGTFGVFAGMLVGRRRPDRHPGPVAGQLRGLLLHGQRPGPA